MNGTPRKIEIFAPFSAALELMQKILFRPFDFTKWLVIGFAAFLAHLAGGGSNSGFNSKFGDWKSHMHSASTDAANSVHNMPGWVIPLAIIAVLAVLCIVAVLLWVGSRGRFIFTDCIVRNRGAIVEPWHEFRREGNSLFFLSLVIALVFIGIVAIGVVTMVIPAVSGGSDVVSGVGFIFGAGFLVLVLVLVALAWAVVSQFIVPIMYRRRCTAMEGLRETTSLIMSNIGPFVLYLLFFIVLAIGVAMISCLATCVTCCITAIPYVGTVILLPIYVTLAAFPLTFLRQFGPEYDVWAGVAPAIDTEPPMQQPPNDIPPPSTPPPPAPPTLPA